MAISDIYLVQYLLQGTQAVPKRIVWREKDTEGYEAEVSGVLLELGLAASTAGSHLYLTLSLKRDKVCIEEPRSTSLFRQRYESEDHRQLAALMSNLQAAIVLQCCSRGPVAVEERCRIRETIFRRVLFEDCEAARPKA